MGELISGVHFYVSFVNSLGKNLALVDLLPKMPMGCQEENLTFFGGGRAPPADAALRRAAGDPLQFSKGATGEQPGWDIRRNTDPFRAIVAASLCRGVQLLLLLSYPHGGPAPWPQPAQQG